MHILVCCEFSGVVRDAFRARGHDAYSVDLLDTESSSDYHIIGDALKALESRRWDLLIAHPPCTFLTNAGVRWLYEKGSDKRIESRWRDMYAAARFFNAFLRADVAKICVENPIMHRYAADRVDAPYTQIIQPWQFGHREMKATCLWLKGLPALKPTDVVGPPPKDPRERAKWAKVHRASPGPDRWKLRSRTYTGIAAAMAAQWG